MNARFIVLASVVTLISVPALPQGANPSDPSSRTAYFGELHLHTTMSLDAWSLGTKITPDLAYKFARGETVTVPAFQVGREEGGTGGDVPARRAWPLDFTAVTDHSEGMGIAAQLDNPQSAYAQSEFGKKAQQQPMMTWLTVAKLRQTGSKEFPADMHAQEAMTNAWGTEVKAANDNYEPGKFTTFIAYEWSSNPDGKNLHRNVIFNADHAPAPFTSMDSPRPEDLWSYLEKVRGQGIDVIAIPHNGNASGGLMYDWNNSDGRPIDEAYAQRRALNEPLTEIVQNKGQSETMPELSSEDEFANFEVWDHLLASPVAKSPGPGSYIRDAFGRGLVIQSRVGANPYKYGLVGASDIHNGLTVSDESAFAGGAAGIDPTTMSPKGDALQEAMGEKASWLFATMKIPPDVMRKAALEYRPGGITGVWAEENTRASIFAALKRKETWATSGTRIRTRMFASWTYAPKMMGARDWVRTAYATGVPMGSDLPASPHHGAPHFAVWALKSPDGANLDRIQIVKVWLDGAGYKEKIFNVALSGDRKADPRTGLAPGVGNTVDLKTGQYTNSIGATMLQTVWTDPEFDAAKPAVYYARVLEIPTPRWSTLLAIKSGLPIPTEAQVTVQERAWTSPVWYTPTKG
jgi:hypothetical protein